MRGDTFVKRQLGGQLILFQQGLASYRDLLGFAANARGLLLEQFLDAAVELGLEQTLEDRLPRLRVRRQQFAETSLRQHDHLPELRAVEAEQDSHRVGHTDRLAGVAFPLTVHLGIELRLRSLLDEAAGRTRARAVLRRRTRHAIACRPKRELQGDLGPQGWVRIGAAHVLRATLAT